MDDAIAGRVLLGSRHRPLHIPPHPLHLPLPHPLPLRLLLRPRYIQWMHWKNYERATSCGSARTVAPSIPSGFGDAHINVCGCCMGLCGECGKVRRNNSGGAVAEAATRMAKMAKTTKRIMKRKKRKGACVLRQIQETMPGKFPHHCPRLLTLFPDTSRGSLASWVWRKVCMLRRTGWCQT